MTGGGNFASLDGGDDKPEEDSKERILIGGRSFYPVGCRITASSGGSHSDCVEIDSDGADLVPEVEHLNVYNIADAVLEVGVKVPLYFNAEDKKFFLASRRRDVVIYATHDSFISIYPEDERDTNYDTQNIQVQNTIDEEDDPLEKFGMLRWDENRWEKYTYAYLQIYLISEDIDVTPPANLHQIWVRPMARQPGWSEYWDEETVTYNNWTDDYGTYGIGHFSRIKILHGTANTWIWGRLDFFGAGEPLTDKDGLLLKTGGTEPGFGGKLIFADKEYLDGDFAPFIHYTNYPYSVAEWGTGIVAHLTPDTPDLTVDVSPPESGTATGTGVYDLDEVVAVEAFPNEGWEFDHWEGSDIAGSEDNPESVTMDANKSVTAIMVEV